MEYSNKVYVITGAASGMGKACSDLLLAQGATVIGIDIEESPYARTATAGAGGVYRHYRADVRDETRICPIISEVAAEFGRIDGLVNAAGVFGNNKPFYELTTDEFDRVMSVNTKGTFVMSRAVAPHMIENGCGKIVNFSCIRSAIYKSNMADYAASKGAVDSMTSAMALDLAPHNIQVNCVRPGFILTGMTAGSLGNPEIRAASEKIIPAGRIGLPEDVASVVLFLLSRASDYVTGTGIFVDGGYHISK